MEKMGISSKSLPQSLIVSLLFSRTNIVACVSPSFDATGFDDVVVSFEHLYRRFNDQIFVEVSIDGGTNWEEFELYEELVNNDFSGTENPVVSNTVISSVAANQSDVIIAFRFFSSEGCAYSWQIDDVTVTDMDPTPFFDMRVNELRDFILLICGNSFSDCVS